MTARRYGIDVLVIGAGIVGAATAYFAARAGLRVCVLDRGGVSSGTTGSGEGNILVSDKEPGPGLELALLSARWWKRIAEERSDAFEYQAKGGLVVASDAAEGEVLRSLMASQRRFGVDTEWIDDPKTVEPGLRDGLFGGVRYRQDAQVMPAVAAAELLSTPGVDFHPGVEVHDLLVSHSGRVIGAVTSAGHYSCGTVVNASGPWAGELTMRWGFPLPVEPRHGVVLVTAPMSDVVQHKVYTVGYVSGLSSTSHELSFSPVVESTLSGSVLIGSCRSRRGFDTSITSVEIRGLAQGAVDLFPVLTTVPVIRAYGGFRPYVADHLPLVGADPRVHGLYHATGHEGSGVGLAPGTAALLVAELLGEELPKWWGELSVARFVGGQHAT